VNAPTAGIEVQAPLHGVKGSGTGPAEQGDEALDFFTDPKAVYVRYRGLF
jgi:acyl-CoA reductase-like NAD-dependent aldehyde dehydrogenase